MPDGLASTIACAICAGLAVKDGLCRECLRSRAFSSRGHSIGCICPPTAELTCGAGQCPRRGRAFSGVNRIKQIQAAVSEAFGTPVGEMKSMRRDREVTRPRQVAMCLAAELTGASLPTIGRAFGGRDHTTVMHARRTISDLADHDIVFATLLESLRRRLSERDQ